MDIFLQLTDLCLMVVSYLATFSVSVWFAT